MKFWKSIFLLVCFPALVFSQTIMIKAGRLIDPETGKALENQMILVEGAVIKEVGANLKLPANAEVIDLSSYSVLPGLIDCHTHLCAVMGHPAGETPRDFFGALLLTVTGNSTGFRAIQGVANARAMLESGFTTVRDVGNAGNYADTDLRRAIEEGIVPGPTIVNSGRIIAPKGGQFASRTPQWMRELFGPDYGRYIGVITPERSDIGNPEYFYADTHDEIKKAIRENIFFGARSIKIVLDDQPYRYSVEDVRFIVEEAAKAAARVAAHTLTEDGARAGVDGGVASIEHAWLVRDETLELAKKNGVYLVGTDFNKASIAQMGMPPQLYDKLVARLKRARKIGVPMAFGSDIFFEPPGFTRGTLAISFIDVYTDGGLTPAEILRMMTTNAAKLLGLENERGAIKSGLMADIIATPKNPLEDVSTLKNVSFVMKDGKVFRKN